MKIFTALVSLFLTASSVISQPLQNDNGWRPTWGLDRVDQREATLNDRYDYSHDGTGVNVYVFDSGINSAHEEFAGRVELGYTAILDGYGAEDCAGHGSHTASLIGGKTYGVAKNVRLISVRVLNCTNSNPSSASLYPAIDWMVEHHQPGVPAVVNMSVGMSKSEAFNKAVRKLITDGMIVVVAAGNQNRDACLYSPASEISAISVGAIDKNELRASYSNFGTCLDIFAPGSDLVGAWVGPPNTYRSSSGTSNAAPIVSGIVATMLQKNPNLTQQEVQQMLNATATSGALFNIGTGSPNLLAYSVLEGAPPQTTTTTVSPTTTVFTTTTVPAPVASTTTFAPTTTVAQPQVVDLRCSNPAARTYFYGVPYVCVNTGNELMWISKRYSPGRP
jgi:subtilisin family serine protease